MTPSEPLIRNISDTARWVAVYRAGETERADPLFRDPFARRLAGTRGEEIAAVVRKRMMQSWPLVLRTYLFDSLIAEHLRQGGDMVLVLAAGLDARPYRMGLPQSLPWIEVDLPEILDYKEGVLAGEKPRCALRRVRLDLSDREARRALFAELGRQAKTALVVTEGLLIYFTPEQVASLADDLAEVPGFRRWAIDIASPGLRKRLMKQVGGLLAEAKAPFHFSPEEGPAFFTPHGWTPTDVRSVLKWAGKKGRLNPFFHLLSLLPDPKGRLGERPWAAVCLLERQSISSR
jgi:methyltransferase (TIGR00027 family)